MVNRRRAAGCGRSRTSVADHFLNLITGSGSDYVAWTWHYSCPALLRTHSNIRLSNMRCVGVASLISRHVTLSTRSGLI